MGEKLNHHFVPQYLFRLFSGGERRIHLVIKKPHQKLIFDASIKGQCARHKFYGTDEVEDFLANLDGRHAAAYRAVLREVWGNSPTGLSDDEAYCLLEAVMLQRARVPAKAENLGHGSERAALYLFREHLSTIDHPDRDRMLAAIDGGKVTLKEPELETRLQSLKIGLDCVLGIADLRLAVLRNNTDYPFIFGDSPCLFYNRYYYDVPSRGVLGFLSPGLMILMPLDCDTMVFLHDPKTYQMRNGHHIIDVMDRSDVSQLNALQVYSAQNAVYFSDRQAAEYVTELVAAHRASSQESYGGFKVHAPGSMLIDGKFNETNLIQTFEGQLPIRLDLSFLTTGKVPRGEQPGPPRSYEIRALLKKIEDRTAKGVSVEDFVKGMLGDLDEFFAKHNRP
jgi:hypothetical protein